MASAPGEGGAGEGGGQRARHGLLASIGEVEQERRDRYGPIVVGVGVRTRVALVAHTRPSQPEVFAPARIATEVDDLFVDACTEARRPDLAVPPLGYVDVEQYALARRDPGAIGSGECLEQGLADAHAELGGLLQVRAAVRAGGHGRNASQGPLAPPPPGAREQR